MRERVQKWGRRSAPLTQENSGINRQITTHADTPHGSKGTEGDVVWRGTTSGGEDTDDKQGDIEGPPKNRLV